jgi:hypothetical protein
MLKINSILKFSMTVLITGGLSVLMFADNASAVGESNARALGMGGAHTAIARNFRALYYNPANLGLSDNRGNSIEFFSLGTQLNNNAFTYGDYNKYTGAYLTESDKRDILASIPDDGLNLKAIANAGMASFSIGRFAFCASGYGASTVSLPKDPVELILYGNAVKPNLELDDTDGEAWGIADFAFGYGHQVAKWSDGEISAGATVHYLRGIIYERITASEGWAQTLDTAIAAQGNITVLSSRGGSGYSMDLGMAARLSNKYCFSFVIKDLFNSINWSDETEYTYYNFELKPVNANSIDDDSITVSDDTTVSANSFTQKKPAIMKMGLSSSFNEKFLWGIDYEQGFRNTAASSTVPRLSAGIEYRGLEWLPLRTGLSFGGLIGGYASMGFGLDFGCFAFDFAMANRGAVTPNSSKGLLFSMSSEVSF